MPLVVPAGAGLSLDRPYRPVRIVFRLLATGALRADAGDGLRAAAARPLERAGLFTGDAALRALGLAARDCASRPGGSRRTTRPCTILSVTSEIMGNT